jgi:hypothetical protein
VDVVDQVVAKEEDVLLNVRKTPCKTSQASSPCAITQ